ncbi:hypothetical protein HU733_14015 [Pseudomonas paralactis]|uniref:hypothetical protein n=1 Tax=Pseudomonas paralactis TaxID=1615673 RepID=UPI001644126B|nr:hypothetical protein [Pseudomonas paralactis]MBC3256618.1 hypothetical protein [Pseudomonas paralactis]
MKSLTGSSFRKQPNAQYPGAYQLATKAESLIINRGEVLKFSQYITGYGEVSGAKIQSYISPGAFDIKASTVKHSLEVVSVAGGVVPKRWGLVEQEFPESGFVVIMGGMRASEDDRGTSFFDVASSDGEDFANSVFTEIDATSAPFEYSLKVLNKARPGMYSMDFYFTYFNGAEWVVSKERVEFKINNAFERFNGPLSLFAAIAIGVTILGDGVIPFFDWVHGAQLFHSAWSKVVGFICSA